MIRLSIVIPAIGGQDAIEATLVSVLENRPSNCEVILACPESYADPYELGDEILFVRCPDTAGISYLLNRGISSSRSDQIHWLSPAAIVSDGWTESPVDQLINGEFDFVSPLTFSGHDTGRIAVAGIRYGRAGSRKIVGKNVIHPSRKSIRLKVEAPSMVAGFCLRESLLCLGGFSNRFGRELADADLAARVVAAQMKCAVNTSCCIVANSGTDKASGGFHRARQLERLYWCHSKSTGRTTLPVHFAVALFDTLQQFPRPATLTSLVGRFVGAIDHLRPVDEDNGLTSDLESYADVAAQNAA